MTAHRTSFVYVGLAGETALGRPIKSGLYRMASGDDRWELVTRGLTEATAMRAIATHPEHSEIVYVGTQAGTERCRDHGKRWEGGGKRDTWLTVRAMLLTERALE